MLLTSPSRLLARSLSSRMAHGFFWAALLAQFVALPLCLAQSVTPTTQIPAPRARPLPPPSQQEYWAQFDHQDWSAAIASAGQMVAAARQATPPDTFRLASALTLLGNAQLNAQSPVTAEASFTEALKLVDPHVNGADPRLLEPLRGLGYALAAESRHEQAIPYLERSLIVSRRNAGLFDISQQGVLRQLAVSETVLGRPSDGERYMTYLLRVGEHAYGGSDPRMVPILCLVGNWYADIGQMAPARESYRAALAAIGKKLGPLDLGVVEPLRAAASSYIREVNLSSYGIRSQTDYFSGGTQVEPRLPTSADGTSSEGQAMNPRYLSADGEKALLLAIKALDAHENRSTQTLIDTLLQTGDWFVFKQQFDKALPYYKRAWETIGTLPKDALRPGEDPMGFPVQVYYPTPVLAIRNLNRPATEVEDRFVQVEFTVKPDGSVKDARVVDQNGTARQTSQTLQAIGDSRYRPKFVAGEPVETAAMSYRQSFKQRVEKDKETE